MTGPLEMARLHNNEREELLRLRKEVVILQGKYKESLREREELRRQVRFYSDNHRHWDKADPKVEPKVEYEDEKPSSCHLHRSREKSTLILSSSKRLVQVKKIQEFCLAKKTKSWMTFRREVRDV